MNKIYKWKRAEAFKLYFLEATESESDVCVMYTKETEVQKDYYALSFSNVNDKFEVNWALSVNELKDKYSEYEDLTILIELKKQTVLLHDNTSYTIRFSGFTVQYCGNGTENLEELETYSFEKSWFFSKRFERFNLFFASSTKEEADSVVAYTDKNNTKHYEYYKLQKNNVEREVTGYKAIQKRLHNDTETLEIYVTLQEQEIFLAQFMGQLRYYTVPIQHTGKRIYLVAPFKCYLPELDL